MKTTHPLALINTNGVAGLCRQVRFQFCAALALVTMLALTHPASATTYTWNVSSGNWSTTNNWAPNTGIGGPHANDSVTFGNTGASSSPFTVNNTVDFSFGGTVASLTYGDVAAFPGYVYPGTFIPAGKTLTVSTNVVVGGQSPGSGNGSFGYVLGSGTLNVTAPSFLIGNGGASAGAIAVLDLSGLTNFVYNNTNGSIGICTNGGPLSSFTRISGTMTLASGSNYIAASSLNLGTSTSAQGGAGMLTNGVFGGGVQNNSGPVNGFNPNVLTLGPGTNVINARTILVANQKSGFVVANSGGGLRIRGITGADSDANVDIVIGNRNVSGGSGQTTGWLLFNGCPVDIKANSLVVGERIPGTSNNSNGGDAGNGMLQFDNGTVSANSLLMAYCAGNNASASNPSQARGIIQVGAHGTLLIGAGQLFALASSLSNGPSTGTLIVSNGLINCQGPIVMGPSTNSIPPSSAGIATGIIQLIGAGTLSMGPNSYIGSLTNPITALILDTQSVFSLSIPSASYTNVCVQNLSWPSPDTGLTLAVAAMPDNVFNGEVFPFLNFSGTMTNTFNNPNLNLPVGYTGNLSMPGNTIYLTVTSGGGPGSGGQEQLSNQFFLSGATNWTATGSGASLVSTNNTYPTGPNACGSGDVRNIVPLPDPRTGSNVAKLTGSFVAGGSTNTWSQTVPIVAGSTITAGGSTYIAHEDIMSGADSFYYELDFLDLTGALVAAYESTILTNLNCGSPIVDTWNLLAITNQMQVIGGVNTGVVISHAASPARIQVPPLTVTARFKTVFIQRNATDSGSAYFSGAHVGFLLPPVPPTLSSVTPNQITLCTNTVLTCTASSTETTITNVQVIATTTTLGGTTTNTSTYTVGSAGLSVSGLGTASANINLALAANTIYVSVIVNATDADNLTVSSSPASFDTIVPTLVIEAADFNYSGGQFMDTPANGGLWLYQNLVGMAGIDENKATRTNSQIYRPTDAVVIQNAASTSSTAQKFINSANVETEVGFNTPGDWLNYTRTFGSGGSAPAGTYNVYCYLATSGSGEQSSFSQVTSDRTQPNQTTTPLGQFGTSSFTDNSFFNYVYVPLVDSFGNRVSVTVTNGIQTFQSTVVGNPNLAFYLLVPKVPVLTPELLSVYPNAPYQSTNVLSFTVGPADGAAIPTNGISLILNGVAITSGLSFTQVGGNWVVTYAIQSNAVYTAVINVTNASGATLSAPYTVNFDTFSQNNFMIEAEDYDFNGGQFIDNPIQTATNYVATNSYYGFPGNNFANLAVYGVDYTTSNTIAGELFVYRLDASAGTEITTDLLRNRFINQGQDNPVEPLGTTNTDCDVGWWSPGTWLNYTRTFPTNNYQVYGRLASGAAYTNATMSLVTAGQGTPNQTTQLLGTFADPSANGFQSWHWVPLMSNGQMVVVTLGGVETLQVAAPSGAATGSLNANFYMFVPNSAVAPFPITISVSAGTVSIKFPTQNGHSYTVLYSTSLNPVSWQTLSGGIAGDGTVKTVTDSANSGAKRFYKVQAQ